MHRMYALKFNENLNNSLQHDGFCLTTICFGAQHTESVCANNLM